MVEFINSLLNNDALLVTAGLISRLLIIAAAESAVLLLCIIYIIFRLLRKFRTLGTETPDKSAAAAGVEKLKSDLSELVRRTNNWNNYINSIFSSMEDGFVLVDGNNQVVLYNSKAQELLSLSPEVFSEKKAPGIIRREPLASVLESCRKATRSRTNELLLLENGNSKKLEIHTSPIADKYRTGTEFGSLAIIKDVTELLRLENLKKDFVASVSHEFRTPLTLISGFIEMFRAGNDITDEDRKRAFEIMDIETERLKRLISELLSLSEIEHKMSGDGGMIVHVNNVLEYISQSFGLLAQQKGLTMVSDLPDKPLNISGNENWFYLVIKNIVENAIKYTPPGGSIHLRAFVDGPSLCIIVKDTGIGILESEVEHIFERFYRVEKARGSSSGGSGLGLALVKDIIFLFNGTITVESSLGKGSSFTVILPLEEVDPIPESHP